MQFRINYRESNLSEYTDILNKHVLQLHQNTREEKREIEKLKRQLEDRDGEHKREMSQLREYTLWAKSKK